MSANNSNKKKFESVFRKLAEGNVQPFFELLSENAEWRLTGTTRWSKTFKGKEAIEENLNYPLLANFIGQNKQQSKWRILSDNDVIVVESKRDISTKSGIPFSDDHCYVFRLKNNQIIEIIEYGDTMTFND